MTSRRHVLRRRQLARTGIAVVATCAVAGALSAAPPSVALARSGTSASALVGSARHDGSGVVSHGTITLKGVTHPAALPMATATGGHKVRAVPLLLPSTGSPHRVVAPVVPRVSRAAGMASSARVSRVVQNFAGVDAIQNRAAAGFNLEPPDEGLGAGNGFVANFVNVTGAIYRPGGRMVAGPFYLNTFFREPAATNTSDPRVFYDAGSRRWFATILEYKFNSDFTAITESHIDLAVSRRADPTRGWKVYKIPASNTTHAGCPCLADYPIMGIDKYNVYISTNEFTSDESTFNGAQLYAVSKSQLVAGRTSVNIANFENLSVAGAPAFHVQPANTYGASSAEWMMSSLDPNSTYDHRLAVWALTHRRAVTRGGTPRLSVRVIQSESYSFPPNAQTPAGYCSSCAAPTSGVIANDWDAMQEVQYINGRLVGALDTGVTIPGDTAERSGVAWFVVRPSLTHSMVDRHTQVGRQGYLAGQGLYLLYPHVNMTPNGSMAMTFGVGGPQTYPSAGYSVAARGSGFHTIRRAAAGTGPDNGFTGTDLYGPVARWGDYSNGQIVPGTNKVWLATQYIPNTGTGYSNWGNRIFELKMF